MSDTVTTISEAEVEADAQAVEALVVADDLLVEDVSIDGMCGVY